MIQKIKKVLPGKKKETNNLPTRITNDTVAEHREKVLAGGRKLKYPLQYTKRKLVRNTILISLGALVAFVVLVWVQLYVWRDTSEWAYRVTRVVPVPVAQIDGEYVRYSDYLLYYRSTVAVLENQGRSGDDLSKDRMKFQQEQAMDRALEDAYARKVAREHNVALADDKQVNDRIEQQREESGLSESSYSTAINDHLRWTMDELRVAMRNTILRQDVAFAVDEPALKLSETIGERIAKGENLQTLAQEFGSSVEYQEGIVVPKDNSDGGLSIAADNLEVGKTSSAIKALTGDGYYFITRQTSSDSEIAYSYLKVPLTVFKKDFTAAQDSDKTKLFINIK
jgi:hypothetical protein